jgi:predicted PurR-regulated permease PerM
MRMAKTEKAPSLRSTALRSLERGRAWLQQARNTQTGTMESNGKSTPLPLATAERPVLVGHLGVRSVVRATFALLAIALGIVLVIMLHTIILLLLLGIFIATLIDPGVRLLRKWGIPESIGILLHYLVFLSFAGYLLVSLVPVIAKQLGDIAVLSQSEMQRLLTDRTIALPLVSRETNIRLTMYLRMVLHDLSIGGLPDALRTFGDNLATLTSGSLQFAAAFARSALGFALDTFIVLLFAFFIQLEKQRSFTWFKRLFPRTYWPYIDAKAGMIYERLGMWARGQLMLCLSIGLLTLACLLILRMPYALTLGILAGFTEFIPYVGPLIGAVPAVLIAVAHGGFGWALIVAGVYYLIQTCENNLVVPLIMKHAVNLSAVAIMLSMMVGVSFPMVIHPVLGILVSIPLASIGSIFLEDLRRHRREQSPA